MVACRWACGMGGQWVGWWGDEAWGQCGAAQGVCQWWGRACGDTLTGVPAAQRGVEGGC
jgi:hypothetical protein